MAYNWQTDQYKQKVSAPSGYRLTFPRILCTLSKVSWSIIDPRPSASEADTLSTELQPQGGGLSPIQKLAW